MHGYSQKSLVIEQRKARRYELRLPFELVKTGGEQLSLSGQTVNVSSVGVLFTRLEIKAEIGDPVEYLITLPTPEEGETVRIRCLGKIVRLNTVGVAATLERYEFLRSSRLALTQRPGESASKSALKRKAAP